MCASECVFIHVYVVCACECMRMAAHMCDHLCAYLSV